MDNQRPEECSGVPCSNTISAVVEKPTVSNTHSKVIVIHKKTTPIPINTVTQPVRKINVTPSRKAAQGRSDTPVPGSMNESFVSTQSKSTSPQGVKCKGKAGSTTRVNEAIDSIQTLKIMTNMETILETIMTELNQLREDQLKFKNTYDKRDDFNFDIVNFPFLDGDVPRRPSYGVYISQLIRFARVCSHVDDFNTRNKCLTAKLLKQGYRYHKLRKAFSKFYRRHNELITKFNVGLKSLLQQFLSEPDFYGDLVYKLKKIRGMTDFSRQFRKVIMRYKRIGYNLNVMRQSTCLAINPIMVDSFAALFNCTPVDRASDSMMAPT